MRARIASFALSVAVTLMAGAASDGPALGRKVLRLPVRVYRDKMKAGWVGQMAGVAWGGPTEFQFRDAIMPEERMPLWRPAFINDAFGQDDLYVEMTFLRTLDQHGLQSSIRQAGIDFANSEYPLWCANHAGRANLRRGIAPPDSSHPRFNRCPNDIDYQIEADYSGLIAPGMPQLAVALGEKFGRLMNYGDGLYAGQFIGGMYAAAFCESDVVRVVEASLQCIPSGSQYAEMVRDMLRWYRAEPEDWQKTWALAQRKYREDPAYQKASNGGIDCKINGAYVLMGLLYGKGDPDRTIVIACRCGQDSDCNPSSAGGVLFTLLGYSRISQRFASTLDETRVFSHTAYSFPRLLAVCEKLARQAVCRQGGRVERDSSGEEVFVIPVRPVKPSKLELSWAPGPIANSRFTRAEMARMHFAGSPRTVQPAVDRVLPGWRVSDCGPGEEPGPHAEFRGRRNVLATHPLSPDTGSVLTRSVRIPARGQTILRVTVSHHPQGDWGLIVRADGKELLNRLVGKETVAEDGWLTAQVDLTAFAGKRVKLELANQPNGWSFEAAYWAEVALETSAG